MEFQARTQLTDAETQRWSEFHRFAPTRHYMQAPGWGEIERNDDRFEGKSPLYLSCTRDGELVLTGLAVRRRLPASRYCFYELNRGPIFNDPAILDEWLAWAMPRFRDDAARVRVAPQWRLADGGDDVETLLERHGFVRRRRLGMWSTLLIDISADETALLHSFRRQTRQSITKCRKGGITVQAEDGRGARALLSEMHAGVAARAGVHPLTVKEIDRIDRGWLRGGEGGTVLIARQEGRPISAGLVIVDGGTAYLQTLASVDERGGLPASHLLVWEVMRWSREHGCGLFDFCGYSLFAQPGESLAGVNQFKRGFAPDAKPLRLVAPHENITRPLVQGAYTRARWAERQYRSWRRGRTAGREDTV